MKTIYEQNEELLSNFNTSTLGAIYNKINLQTEKIKKIQFIPFSNSPIERISCSYLATQTIKDKDGVSFYVEPKSPYPGDAFIFLIDIPEKNILKGDSCILKNYKEKNSKREQDQYLVELKNGKEITVPITSCCYDKNYKFLYFCKVLTNHKSYFANNTKNNLTEEDKKKMFPSHFSDDDNPLIFAFRYYGNLTKEISIMAREQFNLKFPNIKKLEDEGELAVLLLAEMPTNSKNKPTLNDCYIRPIKKWGDLNQDKQLKLSFRS